MVSEYELIVVSDPDDKATAQTLTQVKKLLSGKTGKITAEKTWGKKLLSYKIGKFTAGIYTFFGLQMEGTQVAPVSEKIKTTSGVIRHLFVKKEKAKKEKVHTKAKKA